MIHTNLTTVQAGEDTKELKDWGIDPSLTKVTKSQAADVLSFRITMEDGTADPLIAVNTKIVMRTGVSYDDQTRVFSGGEIYFVGTIIDIPITAGAEDEFHVYTVVGSWYDLENIVFQQKWFAQLPFTSTVTEQFTSHILMPWKVGVGTVTIHEQLAECINYAIEESGVEIALGELDVIRTEELDDFDAITVPMNEFRDITVAEAIKQMLKWCPDAVTWWDYTNEVDDEPVPLFHCKIWKRLPRVELDLEDGVTTKGDITPRYDLQRERVFVRYQQANQIGEQTLTRFIEDAYPPGTTGREVGTMLITLEMDGVKMAFSKTELDCPTIDAFSSNAATRLAWWKERLPWLKSTYFRNVAVDVGTRTGVLNMPRWLKSGTIPPWLETNEGTQSEDETIKAELRYEKWSAESGGELQQKIGLDGASPQVITVELTSTDAESGTFSDVTANQASEPIPENLARFLADALATLHHSGTVEETRDELVAGVGVGTALDLLGGRASWATMGAMVTTVSERPHEGNRVTTFGPPERLAPQDFIHLLRVNRRERMRWTAANTAATGNHGDGNSVDLGKRTPKMNSTSGPTTSGGGSNTGWLVG